MNILIVSEKPSVSKSIAPIARKHWPADQITFVHANPYRNVKFKYPRGWRLQDYPSVSEPDNDILPLNTWLPNPYLVAQDGSLSVAVTCREQFTKADLIVYACDPDHTGAFAFQVIMEKIFGDDRAKDCPSLRLYSLDEKSILESFADMRPFGEQFVRTLQYGRMKRFFEWNWNVNSLAVLGAAMRRAGVHVGAPPISKFGLQLLYHLRGRQVSEDNLHDEMHRWKGTGRYQRAGRGWQESLGGPASRSQIIENLCLAGLIQTSASTTATPTSTTSATCTPTTEGRVRSVMQLSPLGQAFLANLHPGCLDPDLPFRLHAWCEQGEAAKPAMTRYLNTVFSRQLRFQSKSN